MNKKTLVLGASENPERYSHKAVVKLNNYGHDVIAIGKSTGLINKTPIITQQPKIENLDTVTLYLSPTNQTELYDYVIQLKPKRVIFNPGTENLDFSKKLQEHNIEIVNGCTLVMLSTNQY